MQRLNTLYRARNQKRVSRFVNWREHRIGVSNSKPRVFVSSSPQLIKLMVRYCCTRLTVIFLNSILSVKSWNTTIHLTSFITVSFSMFGYLRCDIAWWNINALNWTVEKLFISAASYVFLFIYLFIYISLIRIDRLLISVYLTSQLMI